MSAVIDWQEVETFLEALGRASGPLVLALFPQRVDQPCLHLRCLAEAIDRAAIEAALASRPQHSLGLVINPAAPLPPDWGQQDSHYSRRRDGSRGRLRSWGAQISHISQAVALWCECDGGLPLEAQEAIPAMAGLPPASLSLWSGGKSLHHYWVFTPGQEIDGASFRDRQRRLAQAFARVAPEARADPSLCNPNRVMRLPGARHPRTGELARIHHWSRETYGAAELDSVLPRLPEHPGGSVAEPAAASRLTAAAHGTPGGGRRSRWFASLPPDRQRHLAVQMLALLPPRQAPGTGTYPAAFATLAALVHHFGPSTAVAIAEEAGWSGEHWDPARKVQQIGPGRLQASIGTLVGRAEDAGWRPSPDLPALADPQADDLAGFHCFSSDELAELAAIVACERLSARDTSRSGACHASSEQQASQPAARLLSLQDCRSSLQQAVTEGTSRQELEALVLSLADQSDRSAYDLRSLLRSIQQENDAAQAIAVEAASIRAAVDRRDLAQALTLDWLCPPSLAAALRIRCRSLPADDVSALMTFLLAVSGCVKLGTRIVASEAAGYHVPCNLYGALVARSGAKKTPVSRLLLLDPLLELRLELARQNQRAFRAWEEENRGLKPLQRSPEPRAVHLLVSDFTAEALAEQLQIQEERGLGLLIHRDELAGLFGNLNAYRSGRGSDEEQLLEAYDGSGFSSLRVSKAGGGRFYERCQLSICGTIQPPVLEALVANGDASGLWARFVFIPLPERVVPLPERESEQELQEAQAASALLASLCRFVYTQPRLSLALAPAARQSFVHYEARCQADVHRTTIAAQGALIGKAAGKALRVAALLHLLHQGCSDGLHHEQVPLEVMERACVLVDHLNAWTMGLHQKVAEGANDLMRLIHRIAVAKGSASWHDIARGLSKAQRREIDSAVAAAAMEALAQLGVGLVERNRRGTPTYRATGDLP